MATFFILGQLFGGQPFELFARETNLKKQNSVHDYYFWHFDSLVRYYEKLNTV